MKQIITKKIDIPELVSTIIAKKNFAKTERVASKILNNILNDVDGGYQSLEILLGIEFDVPDINQFTELLWWHNNAHKENAKVWIKKRNADDFWINDQDGYDLFYHKFLSLICEFIKNAMQNKVGDC